MKKMKLVMTALATGLALLVGAGLLVTSSAHADIGPPSCCIGQK